MATERGVQIFRLEGKNVYINLEQTNEEIWNSFEYSAQKNIKTALQKRPNDFMIYQLSMWAKEREIKCLHLGGGSESIRNFKMKFSSERIPYHVGYKIHNVEYYERLCEAWSVHNGAHEKTDYFPLYRFNQ